jgi:hypothetical protein
MDVINFNKNNAPPSASKLCAKHSNVPSVNFKAEVFAVSGLLINHAPPLHYLASSRYIAARFRIYHLSVLFVSLEYS